MIHLGMFCKTTFTDGYGILILNFSEGIRKLIYLATAKVPRCDT